MKTSSFNIPNFKEPFLVKCGVTYDKPFFLYKGKMWINTDKDIARGNTYGFCSFDEELLNNEIKPEEILAISFNEAMTILEEAFLENKSLVKTLEKYNEEMIELRKVTKQENSFNSNAKGYYYHKKLKKWRAIIGIDGVRKSLGCFETEAEAKSCISKC